MGNDGGSIPTRRELVKESARALNLSEIRANTLESQTHAWNHCPVSDQPLEPSTATVSDSRGRLYAYEAILQCLMPTTDDDKPLPESQVSNFSNTGIKALKDVVKLKFHVKGGEKGGNEIRACPISMKELGPSTKSVYLVPCGHVFAEAAMKEILPASAASTATATATATATTNDDASSASPAESKDKEQECPECSSPFLAPRDIIPILPTEKADMDRLAKRSESLKESGLAHNLKKDKSNKKKRKAEEDGEEQGKENNIKKEKKNKNKSAGGIESRINNSATASLTAKVLAEEEVRKKRARMAAAAAGR